MIAGPISDISENGYIPWKYNADNELDIEYLFPELVKSFRENTGLTIDKNGSLYANNIKAINFKGNYVYLSKDEDGNLIVDIRAPKHEISRFNDVDGSTDSILRIRNQVLTGAIIPYDDEQILGKSVYGSDWEIGEVHEYFNWNGTNEDILTLSTNERIFATNQESFFKIAVYDGYASMNNDIVPEPVAKYITKEITGPIRGIAPKTNSSSIHITVNILDAKIDDENGGISFIPEFKFNLYEIFNHIGQRFHIEIIHEDGIYHNKYVSNDYLYNIGKKPVLSVTPQVTLQSDPSSSGDAKVTTCSGIKYVSNGNINIHLSEIQNLNYLAAVKNKIEYHFDLANSAFNEIEENPDDYIPEEITSTHTYNWVLNLKINNDTFCNTTTSGYVIFKNAFGESDKYEIPVNVLVNTKKNLPISDSLNEYFSDESQRKEHYSINPLSLKSWNSDISLAPSSVINSSYKTGLMVVPGVGLMYPQGNYTNFFPLGNGNYNGLYGTKYFFRTFEPLKDKTKIKIRYGGKFIFKGISKDDILNDNFSCIISKDFGQTWYSLKHVRGTKVLVSENGVDFSVTGILTNINNINDGVEVSWSFPSNIHNSSESESTGGTQNNVIYFKLGLHEKSSLIIKSISLINLNDEEEW